MNWDPGVCILAFLLAFPIGTFCEYLIHRFVLHCPIANFISRGHGKHHAKNAAGTLLVDFFDFSFGIIPFGWLGFLHSTEAGICFLAGGVGFVFSLALIHKWNHEHPERIFWMRPNSHTVHHEGYATHNFGITSHFWDKVFGTFARTPTENETART